ncbi:chemotaxis protein CheC [Desulfonatronovibrio magnus]|uniref:chemotaxis protein CheC n=1 Tax=Desulfonatronovibrio magnus TaxID=698827 RepID=UPI0005EAF2E3|nr:chemotaxis protein CheC [Desulfonatronovibrio magnus]
MQLSDVHKDVLTEVVNIGVGQAASSLNSILDTHVDLSVPELKIVSQDRVMNELAFLARSSLASVILRFEGAVPGQAALLFPPESAVNLVNLLVPEESNIEDMDLDAMRGEALTEIGNIVLNAVMGHFSNFLKLNLDYSIPDFMFESDINEIFNLNHVEGEFAIILARTHFVVEEHAIAGDILLFFGIDSMKSLTEAIDNVLNSL